MKITREQKALVLFFALVLLFLGFGVYYLTGIGHSWNIAASTIDDMSGELQGYTAILYDGSVEKSETTVSQSESEDAKSEASESESKKISELNSKSSEEQSTEGEVSASQAITKSEDDKSSDDAVFDIESVKRTYAAKGASVFVLDLKNISKYYENTVIKAGNHTYGVLAVDKSHNDSEYIKTRLAEYKLAGVDTVIAVMTSFVLIEDYSDIDIALSVYNKNLSSMGVTVDGTFYDDATEIGTVGTILVSPSRVITAKDISSL